MNNEEEKEFKLLDLIDRQLEMMISTARRIAREKIEALSIKIDPSGEFPWEMYEILKENGFINLTIPDDYGGLGLNFWEAGMIAEEIARVDVVPAHIISHQSMVNLPFIDAGRAEGLFSQESLEGAFTWRLCSNGTRGRFRCGKRKNQRCTKRRSLHIEWHQTVRDPWFRCRDHLRFCDDETWKTT